MKSTPVWALAWLFLATCITFSCGGGSSTPPAGSADASTNDSSADGSSEDAQSVGAVDSGIVMGGDSGFDSNGPAGTDSSTNDSATAPETSTGDSATGATCPQGNSYPDGCSASVPASTQFSDFFTTRALQSGQTYATRPPWNVAGVDYPVGIPTGTTLKDPSTASLPAGCSYSNNLVTCSHVANPTFDSFDFSLHGGIALDLQATVTGTITIENSHFVNGMISDAANFFLITVDGGAANLVLTHDVFDGGAPALYHVIAILQFLSTTGTITDTYNAYLRFGGKFMVAATSGNMTSKYNYAEGLCYAPCGQHGEWQIMTFTGTMAAFTFDYNTFLEPAAVDQAAMTSAVYVSSGNANGQVFTLAEVENNTFVANLANGAVTESAAGIEWGYVSVTTSNVKNNYLDPTGAFFCFVDAGGGGTRATISYDGNIDLLDGSTISDATPASCHGHH